ncbi:MAG: glycosyltransferase family 2 protein [Saprospiraceae bacterium]|nr:glycosyltransferase family 2 protein [Saprospiraceae bacterium]
MPYASVVIPVHRRCGTLPFSLRSIQNQSEKNIEIIIVGDGCSDEVRSICKQFVQTDNRIRFLDLPKAPLRGVANRDHAVRSAGSERIFYCDDDDLFLPHHIETLGPELDDNDLIDTPAVTVCPEGHVARGLHDSSHPFQKALLVSEDIKAVFDTHLAHRKVTYLDNSAAWLNAHDHRVVLHMLKAFAARPAVKWKTIQRVTALSLHGARRCGMTDDERAREIEIWSDRIDLKLESYVTNSARLGPHLMRLLLALRDKPPSEQVGLLGKLGLEQNDNSFTDDNFDLHKRKRYRLELFDEGLKLLNRTNSHKKSVAKLINELIDPLLGPHFDPFNSVGLLMQIYSDKEVYEILKECDKRPARILAQTRLQVATGAWNEESNTSLINSFEQMCSYDRFFFGLGVADGLLRQKQFSLALDWCERLHPIRPKVRFELRYWKIRHRLGQVLNRAQLSDEAQHYITQYSTLISK